jgi:hypothetical protein
VGFKTIRANKVKEPKLVGMVVPLRITRRAASCAMLRQIDQTRSLDNISAGGFAISNSDIVIQCLRA